MTPPTRFTLELPAWVPTVLPPRDHRFETVEERVDLAIRLAGENVARKTGGPFGAAVFDQVSGRLLSVGVNIVVPGRCSVAHAEILAIVLAQQARGTHDLGAPDGPPLQLAVSAEPCAMCLGSVPWSGIRSLACGARDEDIRAVGFDEGPKVADWVAALRDRGIEVIRDVRRREATQVLEAYRDAGGEIYNGRSRG